MTALAEFSYCDSLRFFIFNKFEEEKTLFEFFVGKKFMIKKLFYWNIEGKLFFFGENTFFSLMLLFFTDMENISTLWHFVLL
jgi:hypothetical protein